MFSFYQSNNAIHINGMRPFENIFKNQIFYWLQRRLRQNRCKKFGHFDSICTIFSCPSYNKNKKRYVQSDSKLG